MKKVLNLAMYLMVASLMFVSCSDDDNDSTPVVSVDGIYILNEGSTNGSISLIDRNTEEVHNEYFKAINNLPLGTFPQSMAFSDEYALIAVTSTKGGGYVEIVDKGTFKHVKSIPNLSYPREITVVENKAYVSNGSGANAGDKNDVLVIDLTSFEIEKTIKVGAGPEKMVLSGEKLYVANSGGWSNSDKTVSVIDVNTNTVTETITVKSCPKDLAVDANGNIWAYCSGVPSYDSNWALIGIEDAGISKINVSNSEVTSYELTDISTTGLKNICVSNDKKTIYFMSDAVYAMDYKASALPAEKFIDKTFYGIDVNPENGNIWCCSATYGQAGSVIVYNDDAEELKSFEVGIMPNSTSFSY